jgi:hypothetical protein
MRIRKDTSIEKTRARRTEEPIVVTQQRLQRCKGFFGLVVELLGVYYGGKFEQLVLGGETQFAGYREAHKGVGRGGEDVEGLGDGGRVLREVDAVELALCQSCIDEQDSCTYPGSAYPMV